MLRSITVAGAVLSVAAVFGQTNSGPVGRWNQFATQQTLVASDAVTETRVFAIMHIAIHDALNAMERRYAPHSWDVRRPGGSPEAAVAAAAHETLSALLPARQAYIDSEYANALSYIPDGGAKTAGIQTGRRSAQIILGLRANDGSSDSSPVQHANKPGEWKPTPPMPIAFLPHWGKVNPFALRQSAQFRPELPYKLDSVSYASDYNEVKLIGEDGSTLRTGEGSQIAMFWYENSGQGWNRIARVVAAQRGLNLWEAARLFCLMNIAMADGFIAGFEAKYHYNFWRPITAIDEGGSDGNDDTEQQRNWSPFLPTPPVPDYPSTHSVLGAAAAKVLARFCGTDFVSFAFTSGEPFAGLTRSFTSFSQAAWENAQSRVLAGIHFPLACEAGVHQGEQIGEYTWMTLLRPER